MLGVTSMTCSEYLSEVFGSLFERVVQSDSTPQGRYVLNDVYPLAYFCAASWLLAQLTLLLKIQVVRDVTPCRLIKSHQSFEGTRTF